MFTSFDGTADGRCKGQDGAQGPPDLSKKVVNFLSALALEVGGAIRPR
jgi:hypothetical protein